MRVFLGDLDLVNAIQVDEESTLRILYSMALVAASKTANKLRALSVKSKTPPAFIVEFVRNDVKTAYLLARLLGVGRNERSVAYYDVGDGWERVTWRKMSVVLNLSEDADQAPAGGWTSLYLRYKGGMFLPGNQAQSRGRNERGDRVSQGA